jgi:RNA polymerase sigma-70 factor (ECF subfamily)
VTTPQLLHDDELPDGAAAPHASGPAAPTLRDIGARTPGRRQELQSLVALVRAGNEAAFEQLFREYYNPLCVFVQRYVGGAEVAEELVETVFARLWEQRERWEVRGDLTAYLYSAARNQAVTYRRHAAVERRMRERSLRDGVSPGVSQVRYDPQQQSEADELTTAIRNAVECLPERSRLIFTLRWQHHLSYAEIAATLDIATKTVETQLNRALKALRVHLRPYW